MSLPTMVELMRWRSCSNTALMWAWELMVER